MKFIIEDLTEQTKKEYPVIELNDRYIRYIGKDSFGYEIIHMRYLKQIVKDNGKGVKYLITE